MTLWERIMGWINPHRNKPDGERDDDHARSLLLAQERQQVVSRQQTQAERRVQRLETELQVIQRRRR